MAAGLNKAFGLGNDVNAQGDDRGMVGTLHQVRVNGTDGAGDGYELQPSPAAVDQLLLGFDGTATGGVYAPAAAEVAAGTVTLNNGVSLANSALTFGGATQSLVFTPATNPMPNEDIEAGFVAEAEFTPIGSQRELATLIGVGGNFFVRFNNGSLQDGYSADSGGTWRDFRAGTGTVKAGEKHVVSVAYVPSGDGGAQVTLWCGFDGSVAGFCDRSVAGAWAVRRWSWCGAARGRWWCGRR